MTTTVKSKNQSAAQKTVISCNFRSANRMSNEEARALTSVHESFARNLGSALNGMLGLAVDLQMFTLDQLRFEQYAAAIAAFSCLVPLAMRSLQVPVLVECDADLIFPMIDLLLGGTGNPGTSPRAVSEIEEEVLQDFIEMIARQAELAWRLAAGTLSAGKPLSTERLEEQFAQNERLTCLKFSLQTGEHTGRFQLVLPSVVLNALLQQIKPDRQPKRAAVRYFPRQGIRERLLDTDVEVAVELPNLKITVEDLLALLPGSVLKLRTPVRTPGMLIAGGRGIFEAMPVRNGSRKAAQLGRRIATANLEEV